MKKTLLQEAIEADKPFNSIPMDEKLDLLFALYEKKITQRQFIEAIQTYKPTFNSSGHIYSFVHQVMQYAVRTGQIKRIKKCKQIFQ